MRVTNSMISNSSRQHIGRAKNKLMKADEQYNTQQKIQRPSDDPTIAVRSLKFRSTLSALNQYAEKNVKDAMSWMDVTETAMSNVSSILTSMKSYLNQGANDYLEADQRNSVLSTLQQYVQSIFHNEANTDYSGRYVFTGYRTDTSLLFPEDISTKGYDITEKFGYTDVDSISVVTGGASFDSTISEGQEYVDKQADMSKIYRMQLAYKNCSSAPVDVEDGAMPEEEAVEDYVKFTYSYTEEGEEEPTTEELTATTKKSTDEGAYIVGDDDLVYLYDTGEILMGSNLYASIQEKKADIAIEYTKSDFTKGDIRPEMYFGCNSYDSVANTITNYAEPSDQDIHYEVNFSQNMTVNTQARDSISTKIYRNIDYIAQTVAAVDEIESKINEVSKMLNTTTDDTQKASLESLKKTLEDEKKLRFSVMTEAFGKGLTMVDETQQVVSVAVSELGAKYNRLQLTYDKLQDEQTNTEEKLSDNEDIELTDAFINLTQANNLYQASLSATTKILGNTLLNYI